MSKHYKVLINGDLVLSSIPGEYGGYLPGKIFGRLDCRTGMRMRKENRVFFLNLEDAVKHGYRPCMNCKPINKQDFNRISHLIPYKTLDEFYNRDKK